MSRVALRPAVAVITVALTALSRLVPLTFGAFGALVPAAQAAGPQPGAITLHVQSARTVAAKPAIQKGDPVTKYQWLISAEDVGNAHDDSRNCLPARAGGSADFATKCQWPSVRYTPGAVPVMAQGNQDDLNDTKALANLPPGKYLISVTAGRAQGPARWPEGRDQGHRCGAQRLRRWPGRRGDPRDRCCRSQRARPD